MTLEYPKLSLVLAERPNGPVDRAASGVHQRRGDAQSGDGAGGDDHDDDHRRGEVPRQRAGVHAGDLHVRLGGRGR